MKLWLKILFSVTLSLVLLLLLEQVAAYGLKNNRNFKTSYIRKYPIDADLVIQGPCQSEWMIDPLILEKFTGLKGYNLSLTHSNFVDNYLYLLEYLQHQKKPKAVLLYVTPDSFDSTGTNIFSSYRFSYLVQKKEVSDAVKQFDLPYATVGRIPFLKYSYYSNFTFYPAVGGLIDLAKNRKLSQWPTGYVAPVHSWDNGDNFLELTPRSGKFLWSHSMEKYFIKIIELMKKEGVALMVYESPVYSGSERLHNNRKEQLERIDSICKTHVIPFFQFDSLSMKHDAGNYFTTYNTSIKGNKIFNDFLGNFLKDTLPEIIQNQRKKQ